MIRSGVRRFSLFEFTLLLLLIAALVLLVINNSRRGDANKEVIVSEEVGEAVIISDGERDGPSQNIYKRYLGKVLSYYKDNDEPIPSQPATLPRKKVEASIPFHPFENTCKYPIADIYARDVMQRTYSERLRTLKCPVERYPYATQDSEGYIYIHPHFTQWPREKMTKNVSCTIAICEGGLRNPRTNSGKNNVDDVVSFPAPHMKRIWVNANCFYVRCSDHDLGIESEQSFANVLNLSKEKNKIFTEKDLTTFDDFGRDLPTTTAQPINRYSIDILGIDSLSRTMALRHLPRTMETMKKLGYEILLGYNKVGDNSLVNLAPILIGDIPQALQEPKLDQFGDINPNWILPLDKNMDPSDMVFLWNIMKEKYNCTTLFNEDISRLDLGLFSYPPNEFLPGFSSKPADNYYRAFYLTMYKKYHGKSKICRDGDQFQKMFIDLWYRFQKMHKDVCHFGFTFVTTLSHDQGFIVELLDEHINSRMESLHSKGALENSVSILLGDHGNRINHISTTYSGRIEERMPMIAIRFPDGFKEKYPEQYANFQENRYKLTMNFDLHQMLNDFVDMDFSIGKQRQGRGISLFEKIPANRTCMDAYISENFCTCLGDVSHIKKPLVNREAKPEEHIKEKSAAAIRLWLEDQKLTDCVNSLNISFEDQFLSLALNELARDGLRSKHNASNYERARTRAPRLNFISHEFVVHVLVNNNKEIQLHFRINNDVERDRFEVVFEPLVLDPPSDCNFKSIFDVCACLR